MQLGKTSHLIIPRLIPPHTLHHSAETAPRPNAVSHPLSGFMRRAIHRTQIARPE